jgi:hypothetical protein
MSRSRYRNGDEIGRSMGGCNGCTPVKVNGVLCHEQGCPDAWRDYSVPCRECGVRFYREHRLQTYCKDCVEVLR